MSKFRIEHGASKVNLVLLKTNIEDAISQDIDLLASWSNNDRKYIVNELLRFALTQEEEFQRYKTSIAAPPVQIRGSIKSTSLPVRAAQDAGTKSDPAATAHV